MMDKEKTNDDSGPAFPPYWNPETHSSGMTLRDYFAAQALCGLTSNVFAQPKEESERPIDRFASRLAGWSYSIADAMLKERNKEQT